MKSNQVWPNLLRIALSVIALVLLFREVGGGAVVQVLRRARFELLALAFGLFLLGAVIRTFRWRALLNGLGLHPPFLQLLKLYFIGGFFNTFLPSGFGGDVVRVVELGQSEERAAAAGTVVVDRMTGILSQLLLGLLVLPWARDLAPWLVWSFAAIAVIGLAGGALLLQGRWLRALTARLPRALSLAGAGKLAQVYAAITGSGWRAIAVALALSTLFNLLNVIIHWLCGLAVGIQAGLTFYFIIVPLLSLALLAPISVGGLGARDWVAQPLFRAVGVSASQAAGMSLSVYAVAAAVGLVGGLWYLAQGIYGVVRR